jgi:hypothetical protein
MNLIASPLCLYTKYYKCRKKKANLQMRMKKKFQMLIKYFDVYINTITYSQNISCIFEKVTDSYLLPSCIILNDSC